MKQLTPIEIKHIQLGILQEFHDFCILNDIPYSLCAGTLLGAIRHQGYIPWDDDIDVMMLRRDYQKFLLLFHSDRTTLYHYTKQKSYMLPYAKLCDNRTILKEGVVYESDYGVDIDIFPLDFFPDTIEESEKWSNRLGVLKDVANLKNLVLSRNRSTLKNLVIMAGRAALLPVPMKWIIRKVDILAQRYSDKKDGYVGNMTNGYRMKERNPKASGLVDVEFEGRKFKSIENYDSYLSGLFGDYMTPPPVEMQETTHTVTAWWK